MLAQTSSRAPHTPHPTPHTPTLTPASHTPTPRPPHTPTLTPTDEYAGTVGGLCGDSLLGLFMLAGTLGALSVALSISACMIRKVQHKKAANE